MNTKKSRHCMISWSYLCTNSTLPSKISILFFCLSISNPSILLHSCLVRNWYQTKLWLNFASFKRCSCWAVATSKRLEEHIAAVSWKDKFGSRPFSCCCLWQGVEACSVQCELLESPGCGCCITPVRLKALPNWTYHIAPCHIMSYYVISCFAWYVYSVEYRLI